MYTDGEAFMSDNLGRFLNSIQETQAKGGSWKSWKKIKKIYVPKKRCVSSIL